MRSLTQLVSLYPQHH